LELLNFSDYLLHEKGEANQLQKIYLCFGGDSGKKKDICDILFLSIENKSINGNFPILNYNGSRLKRFIVDNLIKEENCYISPFTSNSISDKKEFHLHVGEDDNIPRTVFTKEEVKKLTFPIVAKPSQGESGIGIVKFNTLQELEESSESFSIFSNYIEKVSEDRIIVFKGKVIYWTQRIALNEKAKTLNGSSDEETNFQYILKNVEKLPIEIQNIVDKFSEKFDFLSWFCIDLMIDNNGKYWVVEINSQPGVAFNILSLLYENIYEDFYKEKLNHKTKEILDKISKELIDQDLENSDKFKVE